VARFKNNLSSLLKNVSGVKNVSGALSLTNLVSQVQSGSADKAAKIGSSGDTKKVSISGKVVPQGIQFGKPSQSSSKAASSSGSEWTNLLKQTASGGIASALSGGLGSIGGIGSLVSGIVNLFGGGSGMTTPPPLVDFQLPNSREQTVYVSAKGSSVYQGSAVQANGPSTGAGVYGKAEQMQTSASSPNAQWVQEQSTQIAQAVKNALLNSSSLNDVIAEI
jgi:hypothetical protein